MKVITLCISLCAFVIMRPYNLQQTGLCCGGDDQSYFAHATAIVFGQFPSYRNELFSVGGNAPMHSIGSGLMMAPFVFVFSFLDRMTGSDIQQRRTSANVPSSWSLFGAVAAGVTYFWLGCLLLYTAARRFVSERSAKAAVLLMVLCQGLPLYAFRRPLLNHVHEFFLGACMVALLFKFREEGYGRMVGKGGLLVIGFVVGLIALVRYNNAIAALVWPLALFIEDMRDFKRTEVLKKIGMVYAAAGLAMLAFKILPDAYTRGAGYPSELFALSGSLYFYGARLFHMLFGIDWGLVYTAPFMLVGLGALIALAVPHKKRLLFASAPLLVNIFLIALWRTQGGWYGYRYVIASAIPLLLVPFAFALERSRQKFGEKVYVLWVSLALLPLLSMLCFEGNGSTFTLAQCEQYFGIVGWGNNTYQLEVWKTLLRSPHETVIALLKGGVLYVVYLGALLFGALQSLPSIVIEKYPSFDRVVLIKSGIIYALPMMLYALYARLSRGARGKIPVKGCLP